MLKILCYAMCIVGYSTAYTAQAYAAQCPALLDHAMRPLAQESTVRLCDEFSGKVVLVVNTASKCGYTPQYDGLEKLYQRYRAAGLVVIGFPSNDFSGQEPGKEQQIQTFCRLTYGVQFPMFEKTHVKGPDAAPFFKQLAQASGQAPLWNFYKYLISKQGRVVAHFASHIAPDDVKLVALIESELVRK